MKIVVIQDVQEEVNELDVTGVDVRLSVRKKRKRKKKGIESIKVIHTAWMGTKCSTCPVAVH